MFLWWFWVVLVVVLGVSVAVSGGSYDSGGCSRLDMSKL